MSACYSTIISNSLIKLKYNYQWYEALAEHQGEPFPLIPLVCANGMIPKVHMETKSTNHNLHSHTQLLYSIL